MARLLTLATVLRSAGLEVSEVSGWKTRGASTFGPIRGITCHATAGGRNATDQGEINVLLNGSNTAPPPIAQLYLSRSGRWYVVASGTCNHNKVGWDGPNEGYGNDALIGIEAANDNKDEPWSATQYRSYARGVAALCKAYKLPVSRVAGHKEHQPYATRPSGEGSTKSDPTFNMTTFRADVARALEDDMALSAEQTRDQAVLALYDGLWVAANGKNLPRNPDISYEGVGKAIKQNLIALVVAPLITALTAMDTFDEVKFAKALAPELAQAVVAILPPDRDDVSVQELAEAIRSLIVPPTSS